MNEKRLRDQVIKLANEVPEMRRHLLPLLQRFANSYQEYTERKKKEGEKPLGKEEWEARTQGGSGDEKKPDEKSGEQEKPKFRSEFKSSDPLIRRPRKSVMTTMEERMLTFTKGTDPDDDELGSTHKLFSNRTPSLEDFEKANKEVGEEVRRLDAMLKDESLSKKEREALSDRKWAGESLHTSIKVILENENDAREEEIRLSKVPKWDK